MRGLAFLSLILGFAAGPNVSHASQKTEPFSAGLIPIQFQGVWDVNLNSCAHPASDMRGYVESDGFRFQDTLGAVQRIRIISPNEIEMLVSGSTEGEGWTEKMRWELSPSHDTLIFKSNPKAKPRIRCPENVSK